MSCLMKSLLLRKICHIKTSQIDSFQRVSRPGRLRLLTSEAGEKTCRACSGRNWAVAPIREEPRLNPYGESKIFADITLPWN